MIPSNTLRLSSGLRPPPGSRRYSRCFSRFCDALQKARGRLYVGLLGVIQDALRRKPTSRVCTKPTSISVAKRSLWRNRVESRFAANPGLMYIDRTDTLDMNLHRASLRLEVGSTTLLPKETT